MINYNAEYIYFIKKEILRTDITTGKKMKIWCANSETFGYSYDYDKVKIECDKLNNKNKYKNIRYAIHCTQPIF